MPASEWAQVRQIMYQPSACWLSTENSGDRWLTDEYVLLNVTKNDAFRPLADPDAECPEHRQYNCEACRTDLPDGPYKLTVSRGPVPRDSIPEPDIEFWFRAVSGYAWRPAVPTEWSVAEHPGKAMLWVSNHRPCLLGEPTWTALKRSYDSRYLEVEYAADGNMFRFSTADHIDPDDDCLEGGCPCVSEPFCYAAGIRIPDGQERAARALAAELDSTSKG